MADVGILEKLQYHKSQEKARDRAFATVEEFMGYTNQTESISFGANLTDPESSKVDFNLFITGTLLRVAYMEKNSGKETYAWLVTQKDMGKTFLFLIEKNGKPYSKEKLERYKFGLRSKGDSTVINVEDVAETFLSKKRTGQRLLKTTKVDVMSGGLGPIKGKDVPEIGTPTLIPLPQEKSNEN